MRLLLAAFILALSIGGCVVPAETGPRAEMVVVERGHLCTDVCTHFYDRGSFYLVEGHRHGPNCGHALQQGLWIVMDEPRPQNGPGEPIR